jgi:hypothetical protein
VAPAQLCTAKASGAIARHEVPDRTERVSIDDLSHVARVGWSRYAYEPGSHGEAFLVTCSHARRGCASTYSFLRGWKAAGSLWLCAVQHPFGSKMCPAADGETVMLAPAHAISPRTNGLRGCYVRLLLISVPKRLPRGVWHPPCRGDDAAETLSDKGKPVVRRGRKAPGQAASHHLIAELPKEGLLAGIHRASALGRTCFVQDIPARPRVAPGLAPQRIARLAPVAGGDSLMGVGRTSRDQRSIPGSSLCREVGGATLGGQQHPDLRRRSCARSTTQNIGDGYCPFACIRDCRCGWVSRWR